MILRYMLAGLLAGIFVAMVNPNLDAWEAMFAVLLLVFTATLVREKVL